MVMAYLIDVWLIFWDGGGDGAQAANTISRSHLSSAFTCVSAGQV